jgi:hypothetical protein
LSGTSNIPNLERITFFNGQRLTAEDLTALQVANRDLRWLHNRSLHGWGIGAGFSVTGNAGDTAVQIGPGYAIDCQGREIILTAGLTKSVPAVAAATDGTSPAVYYLVASYLDDSDQSVLQKRAGVCLPSGTVRLTEAPEVDWIAQAQLDTTTQVVLVQIAVLNCQLNSPVNLAVRRSARMSSQPYLAAGETQIIAALWQVWTPPGEAGPIGLVCAVDTSSASFHTTPAYTAHVMGQRVGPDPATGALIVLEPAVSLVNASPTGFTMQAALLDEAKSTSTNWTDLANFANNWWQVVWMGVES